MFQGWNKLPQMGRWLLLSLLVISCFSGVSVKTLNQIWMDHSDDTVLTSLGTSMVARWSSDFRPHGAYVDELRFVIYNSAEIPQAMLALRNGEIDAYDEHVQNDYQWALIIDDNINVTFTPSIRYQALTLNCERFPTNITAFRRAMAFGLDKYRGASIPFPLFNPLDSYFPLIATEWMVENQLTERFYGVDFISGNASLENAGFIDLDGDGWREYDKNDNGVWDPGIDIDDDDPSFVMDLYAPVGSDSAIVTCQILRDGLAYMGVRSNVIEMDFSQILDNMFAGTHWVVCKKETVPVVNMGKLLYNRFRTGAQYNKAPYNYYHFSNTTIDTILDNMTEATTIEEVKQYALEASLLLAFEQPQIVVHCGVVINAYRIDKFEGFFEFKGLGWTTGDNWAAATKVHLKDSLSGPLGGAFNYCLSGNIDTWNPYLQQTDYEKTVFQYIYEKLWNIDPNTWDPIPGLAYDWDIEQTTAEGDILEGQKFTFYLYENETWHDGESFTAADVNHSIHMWRNGPNHGPEMWDIYKVEIPDDYTIELYVNETGYFEWADTTSFYITPEHVWREVENVTAYTPTITEVIGTGPYKLDTWVPGEYITLLRHEDWRWDIRDVPDILQPFTVQSPVGGGICFGQVIIHWSSVEDIFNHNITYTVSYSPDNGTSWVTLTSNLTTTSYIWDSNSVADGSQYLVQVDASCTEGSWYVSTSDATFTINNHHFFQSFTVLSPVGGEIYFGPVIIEWSSVEDIFNHSITYTVSYSPDNGISWIILASNLSATLYFWYSTTVADGSRYLIQVNASCSEGSWQVAFSNATFTIDNVPPTTSLPTTYVSQPSNSSDPPLDLLPVLQILGSVAVLSFAVTSIIIIRRQRIGKSKVLQEIMIADLEMNQLNDYTKILLSFKDVVTQNLGFLFNLLGVSTDEGKKGVLKQINRLIRKGIVSDSEGLFQLTDNGSRFDIDTLQDIDNMSLSLRCSPEKLIQEIQQETAENN